MIKQVNVPTLKTGGRETDLSLDTDLAELQKRIAGLESKINSDGMNHD